MKLTIDDIARLSGFSRATVCRVIAGNNKVKESTREKIYQTMREHHYRANEWKNAEKQRENAVSIIVGDIMEDESSFQGTHPLMVKTLFHRMYEQGYNCYFFNSEYSMKKEDEYLQKSMDLNLSLIHILSQLESNRL